MSTDDPCLSVCIGAFLSVKMILRGCRLKAAAMAVLLAPACLGMEVVPLPPVTPPPGPYPGQTVSYPGSSTDLLRPVLESAEAENPDLPPDARDGVFQKLLFDATWLDSGTDHGFGVTDLELETVLALPVPSRQWPMTVTPAFAVRYLDGPAASDLPPRVYDAAVEFRWRRRLVPRLPRWAVDLAVSPGVFSDFRQGADEALRIPGHAIGVFIWTPQTKLLLGVAYLDREDVGLLPVGGVIWTPREDLEFELAVPRPRIACRIDWPHACPDGAEDWVYLAGEFGGGSWAIRRADRTNDVFAYRDYRLILGLERKAVGRLDARLEIGYVFGRQIEYASSTPDVKPSDTVMLRAGLTY
jgi:hypothetical protein